MKKIKIRTLYLLGIITVGLIALGVGSTYAMFTSRVEINNPITMNTTLNSDSDIIDTVELEIDPGDTRVAVINISNTSSSKLNYASFYIADNENIEVGVTRNFSDGSVPTGSIESNTSKKIYIQVKNNSSSKNKIVLGVLSSTGNIIKSENMVLISDTNIDTTSPELLITGDDMIVKNGLIRHYNALNNQEYSHSSSTGTWKDLSGNYDGEVKNITWNNTYATFNGTSSHVRIGQINDLTNVTVEAYLRLTSLSSNAEQIVSNYNGNGLVLQETDGRPGFSIGSGSNIASSYGINEELMHTITGTYDGTTLKLYIDGVLAASKQVSTSIAIPTDATPMVIGCNPNLTACDGSYINANIYAVRIYNRALTQDEIKQNMTADRISSKDTANDVNGTYTILSNKKISSFSSDNITVTNGTKGSLTKVNDRKYNLSITGVAVSSTLGLTISENSLIDISGNKNSSLTISRYRDGTGPTVTITKNTSSSRTVTYTFTFHEATYGFTVDDITVNEGTKSTFTRVDAKTYTLVVNHSSDGSKTITVKGSSCHDRFGNLNTAKSLTHTVTTDTTKPTISNLSAKAAVNSNTITATLKDNSALAGYAITTASANSCSGSAPTSWTSISGTSYNLNKNVTSYGTYYIWTKDNSGNTACTSKTLYKITYTTAETTTCKINSASLAENSKTLVLKINATCACAAQNTCKSNNSDNGTDSARANLRMYTYGSTNSTYTITTKTNNMFFQDVHYQKSDGVHTTLPSNTTTTSYGNGLIRVFVGYGRTSTVNDVSVTITKIVAGSTTIYNGGFVSY